MTNDYCLSGLVEKRAELAGEAAALERRLAELRASLGHLDATILLFDPGHRPGGIPPKRPPPAPGPFGHGELTRLVYGLLWEAGAPLDAATVAARVIAAKGLDAGDAALAADVRERVRDALRKKAGTVPRRMTLDGGGVKWSVAP